MTEPRGTCPVCKETHPLSELTAHIAAEQADIRNYTISLIQKRHPQWKEADGACERCWKHYRMLGRMVRFFRKPVTSVASK